MSEQPRMMCGGFTPDDKPADEEIQKMVDDLKDDVKAKTGKSDYKHLKALSYKTQVVAGYNYIIKVDGGDEHLHVKIHKPLPHTGNQPHLMAVQSGKKLEDKLEIF